MIDLQQEHLLSLHDVPALLPRGRSGRRIHISAVHRWAQRGIRGVRLEVIRIGGRQYTSYEALQRFAVSSPPSAGPTLPTATGRRRQIDGAMRRLDEIFPSIHQA